MAAFNPVLDLFSEIKVLWNYSRRMEADPFPESVVANWKRSVRVRHGAL